MCFIHYWPVVQAGKRVHKVRVDGDKSGRVAFDVAPVIWAAEGERGRPKSRSETGNRKEVMMQQKEEEEGGRGRKEAGWHGGVGALAGR